MDRFKLLSNKYTKSFEKNNVTVNAIKEALTQINKIFQELDSDKEDVRYTFLFNLTVQLFSKTLDATVSKHKKNIAAVMTKILKEMVDEKLAEK